ncbi:hypothetical protein ACYJ1Y_16020 [Natrialbaceae archaeon A-gly3]
MGNGKTTLSLHDEEVAQQFRELRDASNATSNAEFIKGLIDGSDEIEIRLEDLESVELEMSEEAKETRAMAVGILEAMQRTGIKEDLIDLITELRKSEMVESNKEIVEYLLQKAKADEPLNEADYALIDLVVRIEESRKEGGAALAIAEGLFGEVEETTTEKTTTGTSTKEMGAGINTSIETTDEEI